MESLRITRGLPSAFEIAALVAVLARCGSPATAGPPARRAWAGPGRDPRARPGAWRLSGLPT
ncbi:acyl-CoA carboxylase epsilon subunit [Amycolatopsis sp. NPDC005003]